MLYVEKKTKLYQWDKFRKRTGVEWTENKSGKIREWRNRERTRREVWRVDRRGGGAVRMRGKQAIGPDDTPAEA